MHFKNGILLNSRMKWCNMLSHHNVTLHCVYAVSVPHKATFTCIFFIRLATGQSWKNPIHMIQISWHVFKLCEVHVPSFARFQNTVGG